MKDISCVLTMLFVALHLSNASAFETDSTTSGEWMRSYGENGYLIAAGPSSWNEASLTTEGASDWVWSRASGLPQALLYPNRRSAIASCYYSATTFTVHITFNDQQEHRVAFYFLDWDQNGRAQRVERLDSGGATIEQTELSGFQRGKYLIFTATGEIRLRLTRVAGFNAVLSGVFLDGPLNDQFLPATPIINPNGGTFEGSVEVEMIGPTEGSAVYFTANGTDPHVNGMPYSGPINIMESLTIRAVARNQYGQSEETTASFTITPSSAPVEYLGSDQVNQGSWIGKYGKEGYFVTYFAPDFPNYMGLNISDTHRWVWSWPTPSPLALQMPTEPQNRYAACWFNPESLGFEFIFNEPGQHMISVYAIDWDQAGRSQKIEIIEPESGRVLDTQVVSDFSDGIYLRWRVAATVLMRVTRLTGPNAVLSGVFLDPPYLQMVEPVSISPNGGTYSGSVDVTLSTITPNAAIRYTTDGSTPTANSPLYAAPIALQNSATLTAVAFRQNQQPSVPQSAYFNVIPSGPTAARFLGEDRVTQGSWLSSGLYGNDGFILIGDETIWTNQSSFSFVPWNDHIWAFNRGEPAALEKYTSPERIAACRYSADQIRMPLFFNGNAARRLSFYFLDWDTSDRAQRIEVVDESGTVVDSRVIENFHNGVYLSWEVTAPVTFRLRRLSGANAVVSAVFMDFVAGSGAE